MAFADEEAIVTWAAAVLHWLTMASADKKESGAAM